MTPNLRLRTAEAGVVAGLGVDLAGLLVEVDDSPGPAELDTCRSGELRAGPAGCCSPSCAAPQPHCDEGRTRSHTPSRARSGRSRLSSPYSAELRPGRVMDTVRGERGVAFAGCRLRLGGFGVALGPTAPWSLRWLPFPRPGCAGTASNSARPAGTPDPARADVRSDAPRSPTPRRPASGTPPRSARTPTGGSPWPAGPPTQPPQGPGTGHPAGPPDTSSGGPPTPDATAATSAA
jgi:hypothetical protein